MRERRPPVLRSIATTALSNLTLPLSALATGPLLARALEPDGRGELAAVLAPLALVVLMGTFGIPESLTYLVATRRADRQGASVSGLRLGVLCGGLAFLLIAALAPVLLDDYPGGQRLLVLLSLTLPLIMGVGMLRGVAQGAGRFDLVNRERWTSVVSRLALIAALALAGQLTVERAAWATHGTAVLATLMLLPIASGRRTRSEELPRPRASVVLNFGLRSWLGTLSSLLVLRLDQVLLTPLSDARQLGFYAVAVSLAELPAMALGAVRDVLFSASADRSDPHLVAKATRVIVLISVPASLIGIGLAPWLIPFLFGSDYEPAVRMAQVLFIASVPGGVSVVLSAGLLGAGHPGLTSFAQFGAAVVTVAGLVLLVPSQGALGAAYASIAAYLAAAALTVFGMVRVTEIRARDCFIPRRTDAQELLVRTQSVVRKLRSSIGS